MLRMLVLGVCCFSVAQLYGESTKAAFDAFRDSVMNQQLVLRNFSGEEKVRAEWTRTRFALDEPKWHMFGVVQIHSVKMKGEQIKLGCERHVVLWNDANSLARYPGRRFGGDLG